MNGSGPADVDEEIGHLLRRIDSSAGQAGRLAVVDAFTEEDGRAPSSIEIGEWVEFIEAVHTYVNEPSGVYVLEFKPRNDEWSVDSVHVTTTSLDARLTELRDEWEDYLDVSFRWNTEPLELRGCDGR